MNLVAELFELVRIASELVRPGTLRAAEWQVRAEAVLSEPPPPNKSEILETLRECQDFLLTLRPDVPLNSSLHVALLAKVSEAILNEEMIRDGRPAEVVHLSLAKETWRIRDLNQELLRALKSLVDTIDSLGPQGGEKMDRARAVIAKAEGKL